MTEARLASLIPLPMEPKTLISVIEKAKDWALMHGIGMRGKEQPSNDRIQIYPFVLLPSPFPRTEFNKAVELQPILNELMHKVAHDEEFLQQALQDAVQVDEFTARLYDIWMKVRDEGIAQAISFGIFRSDYLLEARDSNCIKQVETNTTACALGVTATHMTNMHRFVLRQLDHGKLIENVPENHALSGLCSGIIEAFDLFAEPAAVVLFVPVEDACNVYDHRFLEFQITEERPDIQIYRKTLYEIYESTTLNEKKQLILEGRPVAVVYYRTGCHPCNYPTQSEWDARLRVERSTAIKCPSIQYQLAGTKKVQQVLATPGALERFLADSAVSRVRDSFTGLYSLDFDDNGERAVQMALDDPDRFVLKPEREGGGNNIYGAEIKEALTKMRHSRERAAYILMERIQPPLVRGYLIRAGEAVPPPLTDLVTEIGVFGVIIGTSERILYNKQAGHTVRTKPAGEDEAGVRAGGGAIDSPYLV